MMSLYNDPGIPQLNWTQTTPRLQPVGVSPLGSLAASLEEVAQAQRQRKLDEQKLRAGQLTQKLDEMKIAEELRARADEEALRKEIGAATTPLTEAPGKPRIGPPLLTGNTPEEQQRLIENALMRYNPEKAGEILRLRNTQATTAQRGETAKMNFLAKFQKNPANLKMIAKANPELFQTLGFNFDEIQGIQDLPDDIPDLTTKLDPVTGVTMYLRNNQWFPLSRPTTLSRDLALGNIQARTDITVQGQKDAASFQNALQREMKENPPIDRPSSQAKYTGPYGSVRFDQNGTLYFQDSTGQRVVPVRSYEEGKALADGRTGTPDRMPMVQPEPGAPTMPITGGQTTTLPIRMDEPGRVEIPTQAATSAVDLGVLPQPTPIPASGTTPVFKSPAEQKAEEATQKEAVEQEKIRRQVVGDWRKDKTTVTLQAAFQKDAALNALERDIERSLRRKQNVGIQQMAQVYGFIQGLDDSVVKAAELQMFKESANNIWNNFKLSLNYVSGDARRILEEETSRKLIDLRRGMMDGLRKFGTLHHRNFEANYNMPGVIPAPYADTSTGTPAVTSGEDFGL